MKIEIDNETKVIAILSGYIRELKEGKDYLKTTYKTAKLIIHIMNAKDLITLLGDIKCNHEQYGYLTQGVLDRIEKTQTEFENFELADEEIEKESNDNLKT